MGILYDIIKNSELQKEVIDARVWPDQGRSEADESKPSIVKHEQVEPQTTSSKS